VAAGTDPAAEAGGPSRDAGKDARAVQDAARDGRPLDGAPHEADAEGSDARVSDGHIEDTHVADAGPAGFTTAAFGLHITNPSVAWPSIGFGGLRFWDNRTSWSDMQGVGAGTYDWTTFDAWFSEIGAHPPVKPIYTFGRTPKWAAANPDAASPYAAGESSPPADIATWNQFVTSVVQRSVSSTHAHFEAYEMWNEPNDPEFWAGTVNQLEQLAASAYPILHQNDSTALVLNPPPSNIQATGSDTGIDWLDSYLATGACAYTDVVSVHGYLYDGGATCTYEGADGGQTTSGMCAEELAPNLAALETMLGNHPACAGKPLWISETSWGVNNGTPNLTDLTAQAAFLARYYLIALSSGVARVYWYGWDYSPWGTLWDPTNGAHPAAVAYGQVIDWLTGARFQAPCAAQGPVWTCALTAADGSPALAAWTTGAEASFTVPAEYTHARDLTGTTKAVTGSIELEGRPVLLVP
jgi:hypothetical protein